jgi:hypothetical protein
MHLDSFPLVLVKFRDGTNRGGGKEKGECDEKGEQKPYIQFSLFIKFRFSKTRDMILSGSMTSKI